MEAFETPQEEWIEIHEYKPGQFTWKYRLNGRLVWLSDDGELESDDGTVKTYGSFAEATEAARTVIQRRKWRPSDHIVKLNIRTCDTGLVSLEPITTIS